ncbi:hypothetical protein FB446DRAFT_642021 [Lentinula raphanica]|nr:hypothetical protein FB446DRAFT_642021 [Lentinula raphanica]
MRMAGQSSSDEKYRIALENMRYKACTKSDIIFLNTLISSNTPGRPSAKFEPWRSAPIIVGENKYKDEINRLGTLRFASENLQKLSRFYSDDIVSSVNGSTSKLSTKSKKSVINSISEELQKLLWDLPTSTYDLNCPAILDLCIGLPVIIRHNVATELSITKGQKGFIYAWHTTKGNFGQDVLDTVFVLLDDPPNDVQIEDLPSNVVPISRRKTTGYVTLPDDTKIHITRNQVDILPGFAMTAHASQGQSLASNAVDLNTLTDHHAWYTALSRSRSAEKTLILQGFDSSKVTGGASGALRREYRELELLDEITKLRFNNLLPSSVCGSTRKLLIETFLQWKGSEHLPSHVHSSIKWSKSDPYVLQQELLPSWTTMDKKKFQEFKQNSNFSSHSKSGSFQHPLGNSSLITSYFKQKKSGNIQLHRTSSFVEVAHIPVTTIWSDNSCAFDAVFPILYQSWIENVSLLYDCYSVLPSVIENFEKVQSNTMSMNEARDSYRLSLAMRNPRRFTFGSYCAVTEVLEDLLHTCTPFIKCSLWCEQNHRPRRQPASVRHCNIPEMRDVAPISTGQWLHDNSPVTWSNVCHVCNGIVIKEYDIQYAPPFIVFPCDALPNMQITENVSMRTQAEVSVTYLLKGIIYYSSIRQHFISRIITAQGLVYQHDGMMNGGEPVLEYTSLHGVDLNVCQAARLTSVIYRRA